jgi:hypothetical protein
MAFASRESAFCARRGALFGLERCFADLGDLGDLERFLGALGDMVFSFSRRECGARVMLVSTLIFSVFPSLSRLDPSSADARTPAPGTPDTISAISTLLDCAHLAASGGPRGFAGLLRSSQRLATLENANQYHYDRDDQEDVNKSAHGVRGNQTKQPQDDQDDSDGFEHLTPPPPVRVALTTHRHCGGSRPQDHLRW